MTTRTPAWRNASSSAGQSRSFPRLWRRPGFRARMLICSLSTAFREISRSTVCSVGDGVPSSPTPRNCSTSIPKEACERYRLVLIPVIHLNRESNLGRRRSYAFKSGSDKLPAKSHGEPIPEMYASEALSPFAGHRSAIARRRQWLGCDAARRGVASLGGARSLAVPKTGCNWNDTAANERESETGFEFWEPPPAIILLC